MPPNDIYFPIMAKQVDGKQRHAAIFQYNRKWKLAACRDISKQKMGNDK